MNFIQQLVAFVATTFLLLTTTHAWGGFHTSCTNIAVRKTILSAKCKNGSGKYVSTSIDLNKCLANYKGYLACAPNFNGQYSSSCKDCGIASITQYIFSCKCAPGYATNAINLNECIANYGGNLACAKQ